ncbi:MAG TPA: cyclic nucleotide-binding domain-containing protein [Vicinamibacteria bacterium]|nr:cyclic nucleotide-binding domain-containing protein [Vicinamibacteria bacterium]
MPELTRIQAVVFLQSCDLFSYCRADEILRIAAIAQERQLRAGEKVYARTGPADFLYCLVHGAVGVSGPAGESRTIGPLQTFGVREILCGRLRGEDAVAQTDSLVLAIEAEELFDLLSNNIEIVKALFRHLLSDRRVETTVPVE